MTVSSAYPSATMPLRMLCAVLGLAVFATAWQSPSTMIKPTNGLMRTTGTSKSSLSMSSLSPQQEDSGSSSSNVGISVSSIQNPSILPSTQRSPMVPSMPPRRGQLHKDVVIIGGGLAGLSTALYLTQIDPERRITILDKNEDGAEAEAGNQASMAAAGMLAPNSERLPKGDYRDLCLASKRMYTDFVALVEGMAQESGPEGHKHLWKESDKSVSLEPWNIGYVASGGFLAPAFAGDTVATWAPPEDEEGKTPSAFWLDATQVRELEPHLHPDVVGGWWFPEDASVDARRLTCSLKGACVGAGVEFLCGSRNEASSLDLQDGICKGVWLGSHQSRYLAAKAVLVANGAWMRNLLPVPLEPHKGQSLSLRMPADRPPILRRVLFGGDSYIVPKADGRIVIGATVEAGSFDASVTPAGVMHVLQHALQLVPGLQDLPIEETWAGLRPTTPDKGPILGQTPWENLFLAGGYWRNGVLLAPKTGHLLATLIASSHKNKNKNDNDVPLPQLSQEDQIMLDAFSWDRFTTPEGGKKMAADARYAASMYPVHKRKSGTGIAASVGTELGSYSTARSAGTERSLDRKSFFGSEDDSNDSDAETEDLFEKAAMMGKEDAGVFEGFGDVTTTSTSKSSSESGDPERLKFYYPKQEEALRPRKSSKKNTASKPPIMEVMESSSDDKTSSLAADTKTETTVPYDGSADAITVGSSAQSEETEASEGLDSIYESIRANKAKQDFDLPDQNIQDDRPDPGFRISHVDKKTGESRVIPPYTQPAVFFEGLETEQKECDTETTDKEETSMVSSTATAAGSATASNSNYDETTYDGYQEIFKANASDNRQDELKKMKEARMKNRSSDPPRGVRKKE